MGTLLENTSLPLLIWNASTEIINTTCNGNCSNHTDGGYVFKPSVNELKAYNRVIYIILLVTGLIGNVLTCFVIITRSDMNRSIHIYTFNLATTDLLLLVVYLPFQMIANEYDLTWPLGEGLCRVQYSIVSVTIFSTIGTLVAITMDRHRGVTRPFAWRENSRAVARLALPAIWVIAIILSVPLFVVVKSQEYPPGSGVYYCVEHWEQGGYHGYWTSMFCIQFLFPLLVIVIAHIHIMYRIYKDIDRVSSKHNKRMIRMIIVLSLVYTICTVPQHIAFFWAEFGNLLKLKAAKFIYLIANSLIIAQACVNPIIYGTLRQDFKRSFKSLLMCSRLQYFLYKRFGIGSPACTQFANDVTQFQTLHHRERQPRTVEQGLRQALNVYRLSDTPPLSRLFDAQTQEQDLIPAFKVHIDSNSSTDSGISNTMPGNTVKKSVTFLLASDEEGHCIDVNDGSSKSEYSNKAELLTPIDRKKSGSFYDTLEKERELCELYDFNLLWDSDLRETNL